MLKPRKSLIDPPIPALLIPKKLLKSILYILEQPNLFLNFICTVGEKFKFCIRL